MDAARRYCSSFPSPSSATYSSLSFPASLRWLLASDVFIRTCDGMVDVFLVIYAINVVRINAPQFGVLLAVQAATAMLVYIPAARIAELTGKRPFVIATFCCFALM